MEQNNLIMADGTILDPKVLKVTRAIRQIESGGDYNNYTGDGGTSAGAYQWNNGKVKLTPGQVPQNFKRDAQSVGLDPNDFSPANQNKVAYMKVKSWKDQGRDPEEIAALWNGASKDESTGRFVYNAPEYGVKFRNALGMNNGSVQPTQEQQPLSPNQQPIPETSTIPMTEEKPSIGRSILGQSLDQFKKGRQQVKEAMTTPDFTDAAQLYGKGILSQTAGGLRAAGSPFEWAFNKATDLVKKVPAIEEAFDKTDDAINFVADKISNIKGLQEFMVKNPDADQVVSDLITIGGSIAGGPKVKQGASAVKSKIGQVIEPVTSKIKSKLEDKIVKSNIDDWERIGGDYVKTSKLLDREQAMKKSGTVPESFKDTTQFLSELGIEPKSLIEDGKYNKANQVADTIYNSAKQYDDLLTEQLKVSQQSQMPVKILDELSPDIDRLIDSDSFFTAGEKLLAKNYAEREMNALNNNFKKGIELDKLNIEKGKYWRKKYDISTPNSGVQTKVSGYIGTAMKDLIEAKAGDANVIELNGLLGNYYKSAKFLQELDGKKPKLTKGMKLGRGIVKGVGIATGESLFGIKGGIAGYLLSNSIVHMLENSSNPLKGFILRNLEKKNAKAYTEAVKWLGEKEVERLKRLALPEGKIIEEPIVMGGDNAYGQKVDASGIPIAPEQKPIEILEAKKNPVSVNPKTNKFQKSYNSQGK